MKEKREAESDRRKQSQEGKVRVWVKEETLLYEAELKKLQVELLKFQNHVKEQGLKVVMVFEGRDAAGKGGTIKRIIE
ncbi:MAG: polyphosphate kinase 2, partial [Sulfurimonas sp.]|nr:polyphosphate kinase 2 [Sulfurimonas sp.]